MTAEAVQYPFIESDPALGSVSQFPRLPITLTHRHSASVMGLLDTASAVNVMPAQLGRDLGFVWEEQTCSVSLKGNLAAFEARGVVVMAVVGPFPPVRLVFAWTQAEDAPLILGQANFFMEFDVCFFRSRSVFEVKPK
jgi:hypothetical protein